MFRSFLQGAKLLRSLWPQAGSLNSPMALVVDPSRCLFLAGAWGCTKILDQNCCFSRTSPKMDRSSNLQNRPSKKMFKVDLKFLRAIETFLRWWNAWSILAPVSWQLGTWLIGSQCSWALLTKIRHFFFQHVKFKSLGDHHDHLSSSAPSEKLPKGGLWWTGFLPWLLCSFLVPRDMKRSEIPAEANQKNEEHLPNVSKNPWNQLIGQPLRIIWNLRGIKENIQTHTETNTNYMNTHIENFTKWNTQEHEQLGINNSLLHSFDLYLCLLPCCW